MSEKSQALILALMKSLLRFLERDEKTGTDTHSLALIPLSPRIVEFS